MLFGALVKTWVKVWTIPILGYLINEFSGAKELSTIILAAITGISTIVLSIQTFRKRQKEIKLLEKEIEKYDKEKSSIIKPYSTSRLFDNDSK